MDIPVIVYKNRTTRISVSVGIDVSGDVLTSEIKPDEKGEGDVIVPWHVEFLTDGVDGELVLTIDNSVATGITHVTGFMDMKRMSAGEPLPVWIKPLKVVFRNAVTT